MRNCPYCRIEVGGVAEKCPLCQSRLLGEAETAYFPVHETLKFRMMLYKIQMFAVWCIVIIGIGLDFLFDLKFKAFPTLHWSLILAMWLIVSEYGIVRRFNPETGSARTVTKMVVLILIMLLITAHYFDFMWLAWDWMVPVVLTGMVTANFVLTMIDKHRNAMAYLLSGLVFGLLPSIIIYFRNEKMPPAWNICMIISVILLAGAIVFKGRSVAKELQRRFTL